jgi:glycosyltransferase involved in cell wall biosynthesis
MNVVSTAPVTAFASGGVRREREASRVAQGPAVRDATLSDHPPVRLLTLTTLFPNAVRPRHGIFIANRLRRLCDACDVTSTVIAAVPRFPGAYREQVRIPSSEEILGLRVYHPRYANVPGIAMRLQPRFLAASVLGEIRRRGLDADSFDVVDAHYFYPDGVAAAHVARELGLPLVISARGSDINVIGEIGFARRAMLAAAREAKALIAVSRALAERMAALGMPQDRVHVLRNGVDTGLFIPAPRDVARARLGLAHDGPLVLGVGNLVAEKAWDLLIRAVARLPAASLVIVGDGRLRGALEALAREVAPGRVRFLANMPQTELRFAYAAADVMGLPSLREGWPNVILESMACGTPVLASNVGGVPEILPSGSPSSIAVDRSPETWANALESLMGAALDQEMVRRHATRFEWQDVIAEQCALYESIAGTSRTHTPAMGSEQRPT